VRHRHAAAAQRALDRHDERLFHCLPPRTTRCVYFCRDAAAGQRYHSAHLNVAAEALG
jgi:hypothetical protein